MNKKERVADLKSYRILDSERDQYLDDLTQIASALCDTPIAFISFIEEERQWFKSCVGMNIKEIPISTSFCEITLSNPTKEITVIEDTLKDSRSQNYPLVTAESGFRFYVGTPLLSPENNIIGTLCLLDTKPRKISKNRREALKLLAEKAMDYLETRKKIYEQNETIAFNAVRMKKLTDRAPGVIYQLELTSEGKLYFPFISEGITTLHPILNPEDLLENAELCYDVVLPEDLEMVQQSLLESYQNLTVWDIEYRVSHEEGEVSWHRANAIPQRDEDGTVTWFGTFQDVTPHKKYVETLEQILFDISHVMRRPVANMLGLTSALEDDELDEESLREYSKLLKSVAEEMDQYIRKLNTDYTQVKKDFFLQSS